MDATVSDIPHARRLEYLRSLVLETINQAWANVPVNEAPNYFPADIRQHFAEYIHFYTADCLVVIRANIMEEFNMICQERDIPRRLKLIEDLIVQSSQQSSDYQPVTPELVVQRETNTIKREEVIRLRTLREEQRRSVAELEHQLSKSHSKAQAIITRAVNATTKAVAAEQLLPVDGK